MQSCPCSRRKERMNKWDIRKKSKGEEIQKQRKILRSFIMSLRYIIIYLALASIWALKNSDKQISNIITEEASIKRNPGQVNRFAPNYRPAEDCCE